MKDRDVELMERQLWTELRKREHEKRGAILRDTRERFHGLMSRVVGDEPKQSTAATAVVKASDSLQKCRWPLEAIATQEFDSDFSIPAMDTTGPKPEEIEAMEDIRPDEWMDPECWWSPARAEKMTGCSREKLLKGAREGKLKVRAAKRGLLYWGPSLVGFVDDPNNR